MILRDKFVFVVVHPPREDVASPSKRSKQRMTDLSHLFNKRKILKYFGNKNPFTTVTETKTNTKANQSIKRHGLEK